MTIHREGHRILIVLFSALTLLLALSWFIRGAFDIFVGLQCLASLLIFFLVLQFFRNPIRKTIRNASVVIAPADGTIVTIEEIDEPEYFKDKRLMVSVFMTPLNVHVNRYAISGTVDYYKYHPGKYLVASHPKSSTENERSTVVVNNGSHSLMLRQIAGYVARRIVTYCKTGDQALQGEEFGFIKFGSRVDIIMPLGCMVKVQLGEKVKGGLTTIAEF
jgi:phosphatidylserine decarboxylase